MGGAILWQCPAPLAIAFAVAVCLELWPFWFSESLTSVESLLSGEQENQAFSKSVVPGLWLV